MIALNFQPVDGTEEIAVQDLIQNKEDLIGGQGAGAADQIQVWDGSAFTVYFYRANKTTTPKWTKGPGWVKAGAIANLTEDTIKRGQGVWFARPATAPVKSTITLSGSVSKKSYDHAIAPGFNMISSAFPVDMPLNGGPIDWVAAGAVGGQGAGAADQIQVWDGSAFTVYFYRANKTTTPKWTKGPGWVKAGAIANLTEDVIPAGKGFWFARPDTASAGKLTEKSPLAPAAAE